MPKYSGVFCIYQNNNKEINGDKSVTWKKKKRSDGALWFDRLAGCCRRKKQL